MIKVLNYNSEIENAYIKIQEIAPGIKIPDKSKSFDIYHMVSTILQNKKQKNSMIINLGAYNDASLWVLAKLGYTKLYGLDLRDDIYDMPFYTKIKYLTGDMYNTHFPNNMFDVSISLSAIEHGLMNFGKFFEELRRIMKNNGILLISTDYNETKINTEGIKAFGLSWTIFDKTDIKKLIKTANEYGFYLLSNTNIPKQEGTPHFWNNRKYTTILLGFKLKKENSEPNLPRHINMLCSVIGTHNGIYDYSLYLKKRLIKEYGIRATIYNKMEKIKNNDIVIYQYEGSLPLPNLNKLTKNNKVIIEMHSIPYIFNPSFYLKRIKSASTFMLKGQYLFELLKRSIIHIFHIIFDKNLIEKGKSDIKTLNNYPSDRVIILARSNYLAEKVNLKNYFLAPHIAYPKIGKMIKKDQRLCLGSFGFAYKFKRFDKICKLARKLNIPLTLLLTIPDNSEEDKQKCLKLAQEIKDKYESNLTKIKIGYFGYNYIYAELSRCSHIIFAQKNANQTSGTMRFGIALGKPVIAIDSYQAKEAQVYRVKSLSEINIEYLKSHNEKIELDDGLLYLIKVLSYYGKN